MLGVIWRYKVSPFRDNYPLDRKESGLMKSEMKLTVAAIYSNFTSTIVDDENIEATDEYTVKPRGGKLVLKFSPA